MDTNASVSKDGMSFPFALSYSGVVGTLRKLADQIESDNIVPQQVRLIQRHSIDAFGVQTFILRFVEKRSP